MQTDQFQTFLSFNDLELAKFIFDKLKANNIECILDNTKPILDKSFVDTSINPSIHIRMRPQDFPTAHEVLNEYYSTQLDDVEEDYYLFSFSNEELKEIISKPEEWGHFNYQLAKKILKDRGE